MEINEIDPRARGREIRVSKRCDLEPEGNVAPSSIVFGFIFFFFFATESLFLCGKDREGGFRGCNENHDGRIYILDYRSLENLFTKLGNSYSSFLTRSCIFPIVCFVFAFSFSAIAYRNGQFNPIIISNLLLNNICQS